MNYPLDSLNDCIHLLSKLQEPIFGLEEGVTKFAKGIIQLSNDECYIFAKKWLEAIEKECRKDFITESQLMHFIYVANCVIISKPMTSNPPLAFQKVLKSALKLLSPKLFSKKSSLKSIFNIWNEKGIYEVNFIKSLAEVVNIDMEENSSKKRPREASVDLSDNEYDDEYMLDRDERKALLKRRNSGLSTKESAADIGLVQLIKDFNQFNKFETKPEVVTPQEDLDKLTIKELEEMKDQVDLSERELRKDYFVINLRHMIYNKLVESVNSKLESYETNYEKDLSTIERLDKIYAECEAYGKDVAEIEVKKVARRLKTQRELESDKEKKLQEQEKLNPKHNTQWDKNLKKFIYVPEIGEIESWRER